MDNNILKCSFAPWRHPANWKNNFKEPFKRLRWGVQRMTKGYSDYDLWDLDIFYAKLFSMSLREMAKTTHSYPHDMTHEEWQNRLIELANLFENVNEKDDEILSLEDYSVKAKEWERNKNIAFEKMSEYFYDLWD